MMNEQVKISGCINKVFYAGPTFSAGRLATEDGDMVSFAGNLHAIERQPVILVGRWERHPKFGRQFKVDHVEIDLPTDEEGLTRFIANHPDIKGIGPSRAAKIAQAFGENFEQTLLESPEEIAQVAKVPMPVVENLREVWTSARWSNAVMTRLSGFGLTHHQVTTLVEKLGNNILGVLQHDPYCIIHAIKGFGFKRIDPIARKMGTPKESVPRIRAGIEHCLFEALDQGHCWIESEELIARANTLLIMDCLDSRERIERELDTLLREKRLDCVDLGGRVVIALPFIHKMERDLAEVFAQASLENPHFDPQVDLTDLEGQYDLGALNDRQCEAVVTALSSRISLISGGAGTGKTYTVSTIHRICESHNLKVVLTAPTGKAARRMQETSGREATTIHRLLGYNGKAFSKGPNNLLDADLVIVDEFSMTDVSLAWHLFQALDLDQTSVVLVGDHNQLPPVGAGNILRDLIQTRAIPTTILEHCVRQAGVLKENSTAILKGEVRKTSEKRPDGRCDWYVVDHFTDPLGVTGCLRELFSNILEEKLGFDLLRDVQVLTPTHKGPLGTQALNEEIQRLVQRKRFGVNVPPHQPNHRPPLLKGDKVIQTRNNYDLGVMNGTVGMVRDIRPDGTHLFEFDGEEVLLQKGDEALRDIQLGFALSIHRTQGSEFPCAILIVHKSHAFMHNRSIFYTGVTRARRTAIILGDRWGVRNCAAQIQVNSRNTFLSEFLFESRGMLV